MRNALIDIYPLLLSPGYRPRVAGDEIGGHGYCKALNNSLAFLLSTAPIY
jgi:hypothetical protein